MNGATFQVDRPKDLRRPRPWHRLGYIIEALPAAIADMVQDLELGPSASVLDFGCAERPYRHLLPAEAEYVAADLPGNPVASVEIDPDGTVPLAPERFDAVISTQVLEHVTDPGVYLAECARVLRPGGHLLLSTHGIMVYHPDPDDYWRWTGAGLRRAVREAGFEVVRLEGVMGLAATGIQLVQDSIYWHLPRPLRPLLALVAQTSIRLADRIETPSTRRANALVFALVARKL